MNGTYDHGYLHEFITQSILQWDKEITDTVQAGFRSKTIGTNKYKNRSKYVGQIELTHPFYLNYLYRCATHVNGSKAGFAELALAMNNKMATPLELRPLLHLNWLIIIDGSVQMKIQRSQSTKKLLDSPEHCILRKG